MPFTSLPVRKSHLPSPPSPLPCPLLHLILTYGYSFSRDRGLAKICMCHVFLHPFCSVCLVWRIHTCTTTYSLQAASGH